jgi:hypothetical protein
MAVSRIFSRASEKVASNTLLFGVPLLLVSKELFCFYILDQNRAADVGAHSHSPLSPRGRQDVDSQSSEDRRRSTGSAAAGGRKRARLETGDLRHRLSGPPNLPAEPTDLRQRLSSQDSGTFLRPAPVQTISRPTSSRQVRTASGAQTLPVRSAVYTAPQSRAAPSSKPGSVDLRNRLNAVTPLPTAIPSSVPSSAPRRVPTAAQSTVTDVRSKPAVASAVARPVSLPRAQPAAAAQSQVRLVGVTQSQPPGKLRSQVVMPSVATSQPSAPAGGVKRLASVVKRTNPEPAVVAVPVTQVAPSVAVR